jgi:hypothetical protein
MSAITQSMPRRPQPRLLGAAAAVLAVAVVVAVVLFLTSGGSTAPAHHELQYGGIPKWLPKTENTEERIVTATAAKPALAIQGNTVAVVTPQGKVMATAVGPEVPEEGEFPVPATSPASFVVTLAESPAAIPLDPRDFTVTDEDGHLHHPKVSGLHGGPPPTEVPAGKTVSLRVAGVFPTGDGTLNWAPGSSSPIVAWDFDIEID